MSEFRIKYEHHAKTIKQITELLYEYEDIIEFVILYGSIVEHTEKYDSDVDILIVFADDVDIRTKRIIRAELLEEELPAEIDVHCTSLSEYRNSDSTYMQQIRKGGLFL